MFSIADDYETVRPYYSEQRACVETKEFFLLVADRSGKAYLLPKRAFGGQAEEVSRLLAGEFGKRYRLVK